MQIGAAMFFTDYSMAPAELGLALEQRGFESVWAPEHSHIPLSRKSPFPSGGELPKQYYDAMDPFVTLSNSFAPPVPGEFNLEVIINATGGQLCDAPGLSGCLDRVCAR